MDARYTTDLVHLVAQHLTRLVQTIRQVRNALFVITVESNGNTTAPDDIDRGLTDLAARPNSGLPEFVSMRENKKRHLGAGAGGGDPVVFAGSLTTNRSKIQMVEVMNSLLTGGYIVFAQQFATGLAYGNGGVSVATATGAQQARTDLRAAMVRQFKNFKREELVNKGRRGGSAEQRPNTVKFGGKYGSEKDDWVMATMITTHSTDIFLRSDTYASVRGFAVID